MVSDKVFAELIAEFEPYEVPRRFITCIIYSIGNSDDWLHMRNPNDIDDFMEDHPRMDNLIGRGVMVDYTKVREAIDLEVDYIMASVWRAL